MIERLNVQADLRARLWLPPHQLALVTLWLVTTVIMVTILVQAERGTTSFDTTGYILQVSYVLVLLWYITRSGSSFKKLPEIRPLVFWRWTIAPWIPLLGITWLFIKTVVSDDGNDILSLLMVFAALWIILLCHREVKLTAVLQSVRLAAVTYYSGLAINDHMFPNPRGYAQKTFLVSPMYIAGGLLLTRTNLGRVRLLARQYIPALRSFLYGCLLFLPLGLVNAASGGLRNESFTWVKKWWMPFSLPLWSGILEETWSRLLLVSLIYFLFRPAFQKYPALAVLATVLFSGITFGLGLGRTLDRFLITGLLYGVPFAAIFSRRDLENAIRAHYMVNLIPWLLVFLKA